jgi:hypothetical protein
MQPSKKRRIHDEDPDRSTDNPAILQPTFARKQTGTNLTPHTIPECVSSESTSTYTTIHHVECAGVGRYHEHHERSAHYFDVPFLPLHSNRMTGLRGQHRLADLESYIEEQVHISFVVYMTYDCVSYYEDNKAPTRTTSRRGDRVPGETILLRAPKGCQTCKTTFRKIDTCRKSAEGIWSAS